MTAEELGHLIALAVHTATEPLLVKIAALESRPVVAPDVVNLLADTVADHRTRLIAVEARAPIPGRPGEKGERGEKGADGIGLVGPQGEKGVDGAPGHGRNGIDGKDGLSIKGEPGARGEMGPMGPSGLSVKGETGAAGDTGPPGRDGLGLTSALVDRHGHLIVTFSDGQTKDVGPVVGKDGAAGVDGQHWDPVETKKLITEAVAAIPVPKDGKDGKDGLGFDHMGLVFDEINGVRLKFEQGDRVEEHAIPVPYDAKVWQEGRLYRHGAGVTRQGAWWIAQKDTRTRPGDEGSDWRLAVKAGRDGKNGKDGRNGDGT